MLNAPRIIETRGFISTDIPVFLKIEYEKYDPEKLLCELHLLSDDKKHLDLFKKSILGDKLGNLRIKFSDEGSSGIILNGIRGYRLRNRTATIKISGFEDTIWESRIGNCKHIGVDVELAPGGILRKEGFETLNDDGSIDLEKFCPEDIEWDLSIGKGRACVHYSCEEHVLFDNRAIVRIERPALFYDIDVSKNMSLKNIRDCIQDEVKDICLILSLCYRKTVSWYEIGIDLMLENSKNLFVQPSVRRNVDHKTYSNYQDELINYEHLIGGGLYKLVCALRESPFKDSLRRSISFLSSSESDNTVEVKYFLCVISLESFCDGFVEKVAKAIKMPAGKWEKIEKKLRLSLDELSQEVGDTALTALIEAVKNKLPELKSTTTLKKIVCCCERLTVTTDDLWGKETFETGLSEALKMRNYLFHRALCNEPEKLYDNLVRLQILTERLLLKSLGWPDEKIWRWYDQELELVNRTD